MKDGYPTKKELDKIEKWDFMQKSIVPLIEYVQKRWQYADSGYFEVKGKRVLKIRMSTAGWSGNESLIEALRKNIIFWTFYWAKSVRGGHYFFKVRLSKR
jgi:hypothetical protein